MMTVVLWQTLQFSEQTTREQLAANEQALLSAMSGISRFALLTEEYADLLPYFENLLEDPRVKHAILLDANDSVVASTRPEAIGKPAPDFSILSNHDPHSTITFSWRSKRIYNSEGLLGTLAFEISDEALLKATVEARNLGFTIALVGMSIIAIVGLFVGLALTRRLTQLTLTTSRFAQGELSIRTVIKGHDEISDLGSAFNNMAESLEKYGHHLEDLVSERTAELEKANNELESFNYSVSHDLRAPLRGIDGFSLILLDDFTEQLDGTALEYLGRIRKSVIRMSSLIENMLMLSQTSQAELNCTSVDLSLLAIKTKMELQDSYPDRNVEIQIEPGLTAWADSKLMGIALDNLIGNAWKYTSKQYHAVIDFSCSTINNEIVYSIKDNGVGFDMLHVDKLFGAFQRLHRTEDFEGSGIGLAIVERIIHRHQGRVWAESKSEGAAFYFTLKTD